MKNLPLVSVLINNFKGTKDLEICLNALLKTDYSNVELFVMDCCTPDFNNWIKKFPTVKFFHSDENVGLAEARNLAYSHSNQSADYICFMDDDIYVTPNLLSIIISFMEEYTDVGQAQPVLYQSSNKKEIDSIGHLMTRVGYPYKIPPTEENINNLKLNKSKDIFYSEGAISIVRQKIISSLSNNLKPFDTEYFLFFEDVDLSWRIWLLGYRVVIISEAFCYHDRGVSRGLGNLTSAQISRNTKNRLIMLLKNHQIVDLVKYFPITIFLEISKSLLLLRYNPGHSKVTLKSIFWVITHFPKILKKRNSSRMRDSKLFKAKSDKIFVKIKISELNRGLKLHYS